MMLEGQLVPYLWRHASQFVKFAKRPDFIASIFQQPANGSVHVRWTWCHGQTRHIIFIEGKKRGGADQNRQMEFGVYVAIQLNESQNIERVQADTNA